ncbi:MAG: hypothetical protein V2J02_05750 [Pseudomonadales bacterium]|nr:hypothetical protein [Pseudomonadales bacterium]
MSGIVSAVRIVECLATRAFGSLAFSGTVVPFCMAMLGCVAVQPDEAWRMRFDHGSGWFGRGATLVVDSRGNVVRAGFSDPSQPAAACGRLSPEELRGLQKAFEDWRRETGGRRFHATEACDDGGIERAELVWRDPDGTVHDSAIVLEGCGHSLPPAVDTLMERLWSVRTVASNACVPGALLRSR